MALFRVFRGFLAWFLLFRVCLLGFGALRGLCGFCVREWLGGLEDCGVFASVLSLFPPFFIFFAYLLGLCLCCPRLVLLPALFVLVSLCFLFPLRTIRERKGANTCVLSCPVLLAFSPVGLIVSRWLLVFR